MGLLAALQLPTPPAGGAAFARQSHLNEAATDWRDTHAEASARIAQLHDAIKDHYSDGHPELLTEIEGMSAKLGAILDTVDHKLADALDRAGKAKDPATFEREARAAKKVVSDYIAAIKSEPLVAHMDQNPFGVKTELKALLAGGLAKAAKAIG